MALSRVLPDGDHVHLLIETPAANLATGMQRLHGAYAQAYNARHARVGHVFQGRYGAVRIRSDAQLWATVAYIARNPVEAGLCSLVAEWPWSSHAAVLGSPSPRWLDKSRLLSYFRSAGGEPQQRYIELISGA